MQEQTENIVNQYVTTILQMSRELIQRYETNAKTVKSNTGQITDLEHDLYLGKRRNDEEKIKFVDEMERILLERRHAKDENELIEELVHFFKSQDLEKKLKPIQSNSMKILNAQRMRVYTPRVRTDLTIQATEYEESLQRVSDIVENPNFEQMMKKFQRESRITYEGGKARKK